MREQKGRSRRVFAFLHQPPQMHEAPVIELDVTSGREQTPPTEHQRRRHVWRQLRSRAVPLPLVIALMVAAGAVAIVATDRWQARQERLAPESTASVLVLGKEEIGTGGGDGVRVEFETSVIVVNLGPLPVEVTDIRAANGGLGLHSIGSDVVQPGLRPFTVRLTLDCATRVPADPVPVAVSLRTADGRSRQISTLMPGTPWQSAFDHGCRPLR